MSGRDAPECVPHFRGLVSLLVLDHSTALTLTRSIRVWRLSKNRFSAEKAIKLRQENHSKRWKDGCTSDGNNALQQLPKVGENRRTGVGFHPTEIAPSVQVPNGEGVIEEADKCCT
jgi:hypothetical protein